MPEQVTPDVEALKECIASLLGRIDDLSDERMHWYGQTPDWYVEAAYLSCYGIKATVNVIWSCADHIDYAGETCGECGLPVDAYGNTEDDFKFCSFPDCGCDGARLCMAGEASVRAEGQNVEGMYRRKDRAAVIAKLSLYGSILEDCAQNRRIENGLE